MYFCAFMQILNMKAHKHACNLLYSPIMVKGLYWALCSHVLITELPLRSHMLEPDYTHKNLSQKPSFVNNCSWTTLCQKQTVWFPQSNQLRQRIRAKTETRTIAQLAYMEMENGERLDTMWLASLRAMYSYTHTPS